MFKFSVENRIFLCETCYRGSHVTEEFDTSHISVFQYFGGQRLRQTQYCCSKDGESIFDLTKMGFLGKKFFLFRTNGVKNLSRPSMVVL